MLTAMLVVAAVSCGCASSVSHSSASTSSSRRLSSPRAGERTAPARRLSFGHAEDGRRIVAVRAGDPHAVRLVGCLHGNEDAGMAVARALERRHAGADLSIVPDLNPDGHARVTRQSGRGVDLDANWSSRWHGGGRPGDAYDPGTHPFSERETQIARKLILRIRPRITIWFHPDSPCFTVELPSGSLLPPQVDRHVRAVLALAARAGGSAYT